MSSRALRPDLGPLLFPRSAALVGISDRSSPEIVVNVLGKGMAVLGVHPRLKEVGGLRCVPRITDLPETPDVAFLLVGHTRIEDVFADALGAGIRHFIIPGLGSEAGSEGSAIAARVADHARAGGAVVVGFNCMGLAVPARASFWIGAVPDTFIAGHVAAVVQSGSIGEALLALGPRVGFRCVVSSGSEAVTDVADLCAFFAADEGTRAVGLFLEAVHRPAAFASALDQLAEAGKPVVCCKVGRSAAGARAVLAHSGAIVGSDRAFSALLRGYGVIEVDDYAELVEVLEVLGHHRWPRGVRIGGVTNSGGEGALLADQAQAAGIPFQPLPPSVVTELKAAFPNYLDPQNPVDAWAIDEVDRVFPGTLRILAGSGVYDILLAQVDQSQFLGAGEVVNALLTTHALADAVAGTPIFPAVTSVQTGDPTPAVAAAARERGVAMLRGARNGARALAAVARWKPRRPPLGDSREPVELSDLLRPGPLPEHESGEVLERYGIKVAPRRRVHTADEAAAAAEALGFPVVIKTDGPPHKTRAGGVVLNLHDADSVRAAAARLGGSLLVARQLPAGLEVFCGLTRDPDVGPVLAIGPGGQAVEQLSLAAVCVAPIAMAEACRLVEDAPLVRKASPPAREALARCLVALGRLAVEHREVAAVDVNPLILDDEGATAVDALVVIEEGT